MIKNLVISGGGVKIIGALGAIKYLDENKHLIHVEKFFGTSAGSILCLMLVLGFSSNEIIKFIENFDLNKIFIVNTDELFTTFNVCSSSKLEKVIKLFINFKLGKPCLSGLGSLASDTITMCSIETNYENITMGELYKLTGKTLSVTSVCLEKRAPVYITHLTYPTMPVWKAVLASCSIPLVFQPIEWEGLNYVDGALVDNFPLLIIDPEEIPYTLGIQTFVDLEKTTIPNNQSEYNIYHYIVNIIKIVMESKTQIKSYNVISVIIDPSILNDFLDINLSVETKNKIISQGYAQAKNKYKKFSINSKAHVDLKSKIRLRSKSI
jgi:predicted acylesterase/phospholipase RssA